VEFKETLTPTQQTIYEIVQDYLKKNPFFTINDLLQYCKKNTQIPPPEIQSILTKFVYKQIISSGSKLTKNTVLKNPIRNEIYQFISKNPALNFTQLLKQFNLGSYAARWHLEMLRRFGFIRQKKIKIYNAFFATDFPENKDALVYSLRNQNALKIYLCLQYTPLNSNKLAQILNLNYSTIQYHIKELLQNKLLIPDEGNKFTINPELTDFLNQFYDLTIPEDLKDLCDNLSVVKEKSSPQPDLEFRENIENQLATLTTQLKQLHETILSQQNLTQTIEQIETRLLTIEEEMKNFTETLNKFKKANE